MTAVIPVLTVTMEIQAMANHANNAFVITTSILMQPAIVIQRMADACSASITPLVISVKGVMTFTMEMPSMERAYVSHHYSG